MHGTRAWHTWDLFCREEFKLRVLPKGQLLPLICASSFHPDHCNRKQLDFNKPTSSQPSWLFKVSVRTLLWFVTRTSAISCSVVHLLYSLREHPDSLWILSLNAHVKMPKIVPKTTKHLTHSSLWVSWWHYKKLAISLLLFYREVKWHASNKTANTTAFVKMFSARCFLALADNVRSFSRVKPWDHPWKKIIWIHGREKQQKERIETKLNWNYKTSYSLPLILDFVMQWPSCCFRLKKIGNWIQGEYIRPYNLTKENLDKEKKQAWTL